MKKLISLLAAVAFAVCAKAAVNDVPFSQVVSLGPPIRSNPVSVPMESAITTTLASWRSAQGLGTEDSPGFTNTTLTGYIQLAEQAAPGTPTNAGRIYFDTSNRLSWKGENGFVRTFDGTANLADRIYVLPDVAGTVTLSSGALTSGRIPYVTTGGVLTNSANLTYVDGTAITTTGTYITSNATGYRMQLTGGGSRLLSSTNDGNTVEYFSIRPGTSNVTIEGAGTLQFNSSGVLSAVLSGGAAATLTGGAGNMTIVAGTGNSRTLTFQTTTSGGTATNAIVIGATQTVTISASTTSTSTSTGALVVTGGLGVAGTAWFPNGVHFDSGGALQLVSGGGTYLNASSLVLDGTGTITNNTFANQGNNPITIGTVNAQNTIIRANSSTVLTFSASALGTITGGAQNMTLVAGTGASRTMTLQTTNSGSSNVTFLTANAGSVFVNSQASNSVVLGAAGGSTITAAPVVLRGAADKNIAVDTAGKLYWVTDAGNGYITGAIDALTMDLRISGTSAITIGTTLNSAFGGRIVPKVTSTATAAGTTTLTTSSTLVQIFTGSTTQNVTLPAANLDTAGYSTNFFIKNRSSGTVTINRAGSDTIDGATSYSLTAGNAVHLMSDGVSDWTVQ